MRDRLLPRHLQRYSSHLQQKLNTHAPPSSGKYPVMVTLLLVLIVVPLVAATVQALLGRLPQRTAAAVLLQAPTQAAQEMPREALHQRLKPPLRGILLLQQRLSAALP